MATVLAPGGHFPNASPPISSIEVWPTAQFESLQVNNYLKYNDLIVTGQVIFNGITVTGPATFTAPVVINANIESDNPLSGSLVIVGGIGTTGNINAQGYVGANTFNATSDARQKKDIEIIPDALGLIRDIDAVRYKFRHFDRKKKADKNVHYGVIAQDLQAKGLGSMVTTAKNGSLSVNYNDLVGILLKSVQELDQRMEKIEKLLETMQIE
jgi:hypothetical protein